MADEDSAFRRPVDPSDDSLKTPSSGQSGRERDSDSEPDPGDKSDPNRTSDSGSKPDPDTRPDPGSKPEQDAESDSGAEQISRVDDSEDLLSTPGLRGPRPRTGKRSGLRTRLRKRLGPNLMTAGILVLCGFMVSWAALASHGSDFRPETDDMSGLVRDQASHNADQAKQVAELRAKVDQLSKTQVSDPTVARSIDALSPRAGLTAVSGNAVRVTLDDAPLDVKADGIDENLLVVHQQDIQMVANVLWAGGAEAMTIQGQRITSATGIKCVGNTVVLHGVPYAPPYRIEAIGDVDALNSALAESESVRIYREYVTAYRLGWKVENLGTVTMPAFKGSLGLTHATPVAPK